jgi:hypothetical protein
MAGAEDATRGVEADEVPWKDEPVFPGASIAILVGDPTKAGVAVQRVKCPPNNRVAPHPHPYAEVVTVLSGTLGAAWGHVRSEGRAVEAWGSLRAPRLPPRLRVGHD